MEIAERSFSVGLCGARGKCSGKNFYFEHSCPSYFVESMKDMNSVNSTFQRDHEKIENGRIIVTTPKGGGITRWFSNALLSHSDLAIFEKKIEIHIKNGNKKT